MEFAFLGPQTPKGWEAWDGYNVEVTDQGVSLAMEQTYLPSELVITEPPAGFAAVDFDTDDCGNLWILTQSGEILRFDSRDRKLRQLQCVWHDGDEFTDLQAVGVTEQSLYTADAATGTVHAFSRPLEHIRWIANAPYEHPIAFATMGETVYVLDRGTETGDGFVVRIRRGRGEVVWSGLSSPEDISIDVSGTVYVLDVRDPDTDPKPLIVGIDPTDTDPEERILIPSDHFRTADQSGVLSPSYLEVVSETRVLVGVESGQHGLFQYQPDENVFEAITAFQGPCLGILARQKSDGEVDGFYVIDGERQIRFLGVTRQYSQNKCTSRFDGSIIGRVDSGEQRARWHRATVDASHEEADTQIRLYYAPTGDSNRSEDLEQIGGIGTKYAERLREAGVCYVSNLAKLTAQEAASLSGAPLSRVETDDWIGQAGELRIGWQEVGQSNPEDVLLHDAEGQYLWLKMELLGTPRSSPRIHSLRAYFPRMSYLRYFPSIYQEDERSSIFLERFLSIFESVFTGVEEDIESITRYLDPYGVPPSFLSWLGGWLAIATEDVWPLEARRELISNAPSLFKKRGTRAGLLRILRIYLLHVSTTDEGQAKYGLSYDEQSVEPLYLIEYEDFDCIDVSEAKKDFRKIVSCPQCFLVLVRATLSTEQMRAINRIVETEKPAHALGTAIELRPEIRLGENSYLGINSTLSPQEFEVESATLGRDTILQEREAMGQLGRKSRLNEDLNIS